MPQASEIIKEYNKYRDELKHNESIGFVNYILNPNPIKYPSLESPNLSQNRVLIGKTKNS